MGYVIVHINNYVTELPKTIRNPKRWWCARAWCQEMKRVRTIPTLLQSGTMTQIGTLMLSNKIQSWSSRFSIPTREIRQCRTKFPWSDPRKKS
jgi:galactokinase